MTAPRSVVVHSPSRCVDGLRIAMRVQGEGDPLLLINGMTRPLQSWEQLTRALPGRTIITFDSPGVGASPTPLLPLSMRGLAALATAVLDAAGQPADGAVDVLGFSHGGAVAQQLANDTPRRVRSLVLAATSCGVGATPSQRPPALRSMSTSGAGQPWPRPSTLGVFWHWLAISSWSSIPFLGAITAPTLVVCGTRDRVAPPENSRVLAERIPAASLVLLPAGHDLQRPVPARSLAQLVEDFWPSARATDRAQTRG